MTWPNTITIATRLFWPQRFGGLEQKALRLARGLAERTAMRVRVLTETAPGLADTESPWPGVQIVRLPPLDIGRLWRWRDLLRGRWWRRGLEQWAGDGPIIAFSPMAAAATVGLGWADRLVYVPVFCQATLSWVVGCYPQMKPMMPGRARRRMDRRAYRLASRVVFESLNQRRQFESQYGPRPNASIVPNGTDVTALAATDTAAWRRRVGLPVDAFVVGFAGRPEVSCKDVPFLLQAMAGLPRHLWLLLVGDGADRAEIEQRIGQLGLADRTVWTGWLDPPTEAYAAMNVLAMPSRFETFGMVVIEAMAAGTPVVGRRRSTDPRRPVLVANEELIDHDRTGALVDAHDPTDMARTLGELAASPQRAAAMGQLAQQRAERFGWHHVIDAYAAMLDPGRRRHVLPRLGDAA